MSTPWSNDVRRGYAVYVKAVQDTARSREVMVFVFAEGGGAVESPIFGIRPLFNHAALHGRVTVVLEGLVDREVFMAAIRSSATCAELQCALEGLGLTVAPTPLSALACWGLM